MNKLKNIIYNKLPMQVLSYLTRQRKSDVIYGSRLAPVFGTFLDKKPLKCLAKVHYSG